MCPPHFLRIFIDVGHSAKPLKQAVKNKSCQVYITTLINMSRSWTVSAHPHTSIYCMNQTPTNSWRVTNLSDEDLNTCVDLRRCFTAWVWIHGIWHSTRGRAWWPLPPLPVLTAISTPEVEHWKQLQRERNTGKINPVSPQARLCATEILLQVKDVLNHTILHTIPTLCDNCHIIYFLMMKINNSFTNIEHLLD